LRVSRARSPSFTVTCNINKCQVMASLHRSLSGPSRKAGFVRKDIEDANAAS